MDMAYDLGTTILHAKSDSLLIVNQMNGEFQAKDSKMTAYLKFAKEKSERFEKFSIEQIPRDQNTQADALANLRSAFNEPTIDCIPMIHLTGPSIENEEIVQIDDQVYN